MAHFAQLDENNVVIEVIVVNNAVIGDLQFPESEPVGIAFCQSLPAYKDTITIWKQTSYNANFRSKYAGIGDIYDPVQDIFLQPDGPDPFNPHLLISELP